MAEKGADRSPRAGDYRDTNQQKKYRDERSKYMDVTGKEAAHTVPCQISNEALTNYRAPGRPPKDEADSVKGLADCPYGLRMVGASKNRQDVKVENALKRKATSGETLTFVEEKEARKHVAAIQRNQDELKKATYKSYRNFYDGMETKSGKNVWDGRKDKHDKR